MKIEILTFFHFLLFFIFLKTAYFSENGLFWKRAGLVARNIMRENSRMIGLSATLYNFKDVANFLNVNDCNLFCFDESYRPCKIDIEIIQTENIETEARDALLSEDGPIIVFVYSRKDTYNVANNIIQYLDKINYEGHEFEDEKLAEYFGFGVSIHHAGLSKKTREDIEKLFKMNLIKILIATSTLAWGVNFPARTVIIKGTKYFNEEIGDYVELNYVNKRSTRPRKFR